MTTHELTQTVEILRTLAMATPEGRAAFAQAALAVEHERAANRYLSRAEAEMYELGYRDALAGR